MKMNVIFFLSLFVGVCWGCSQFSHDCEKCIQNKCVLVEFKSKITCVRQDEVIGARAAIHRVSQCRKKEMHFSPDLLQAITTTANRQETRRNPPLFETQNNDGVSLFVDNDSSNSSITLSNDQGVRNDAKMAKDEGNTTLNGDEGRGTYVNASRTANIRFFTWRVPIIGDCTHFEEEKWKERLERAFCNQLFILKQDDRFARLENNALAMFYINPAHTHDTHCNYLKWRRMFCKL